MNAQEALDVLKQALQQQPEKAPAPSCWVTQHTCEVSANQYLRAAKRGELPARRVGKLVVARREDYDRWIESHPTVGPAPQQQEQPANDQDEYDELLASGGLTALPGVVRRPATVSKAKPAKKGRRR